MIDLYDFHMHSDFSFDSDATMESMVKSGIDKGLKELCFTDHIEFAPAPPFERWVVDVNAYHAEISRLQQLYGDKISLKMGAEIGYHPSQIKTANDYIESADFDFILCSLHDINNEDFHHKIFTANKTPKVAFQMYFEEYEKCAKSGINYNCLSHYDFLKRYMQCNYDETFTDNYDTIKSTFKFLIENGKGIEVNTSGYRYGLGHSLPTAEFLRLYRELGGEIITTGSDSHAPKDVAAEFKNTYNLLREIGFKYITRFDKMKPEFISL